MRQTINCSSLFPAVKRACARSLDGMQLEDDGNANAMAHSTHALLSESSMVTHYKVAIKGRYKAKLEAA